MPNYLITGDWHIRAKKPKNRLDTNYLDTILYKIGQIFDIAVQYNCKAIIQPGDMFDDADISDRTIREALRFLKTSPCLILSVPGQHDLRNHSRVWENTPMGIVDGASWPVLILGKHNNPILLPETSNVFVYGSGFDEDIPVPSKDHVYSTFNNEGKLETHGTIGLYCSDEPYYMLICHKLIVHGMVQYAYDFAADEFLKKHPYHFVASGDNHQHFHVEYDQKVLFNCGSLMRTKIDQNDHQPRVYTTDFVTFKEHKLKVTPFDEIMDVEKAREDEEKNEHLQVFLEKVKESRDDNNEELNYKKRLSTRIARSSKALSDGVRGILKEVMDDERWKPSK